jgi:hypothetical protein
MEASADLLVRFLRHQGRTDFIALVYTLTDTGIQQSESVALALEHGCVRHHRAFSFISPGETPRRLQDADEDLDHSGNSNTCDNGSGNTDSSTEDTDTDTKTDDNTVASSIRTAMQRVKATGYRTIVLAMARPFLELPLIADAAEEMGLLSGDYFWVWVGNIDPSLLNLNNITWTR